MELRRDTPICVPCQHNYRCERNGVWVRLGSDHIINADMYECPNCGHRIIRGFAPRKVSRHDGPESYQRAWGIEDKLMGSARITDNGGHPIGARTEPEWLSQCCGAPPSRATPDVGEDNPAGICGQCRENTVFERTELEEK